MSSPKVTDGKVTLFLTLSAEFTNDETEPLLETKRMQVGEDHPLFCALTKIWHWDEQNGQSWADDPMESIVVRRFVRDLELVAGNLLNGA